MQAVNIGIDLGTTNSLIAKYENNKVQIFKNPIGQKETLASVVAYRQDRILIGDKAREYLTKDAINVFGGFKRKMGTDEKYYVVNIDENVTPIDLSVLVLKELKKFVPTTEPIEAAVITVPASFDSMQSAATIKAGELAGFKHTFLLQEPIAASLAFFNETNQTVVEDGHWLVYDFGGGTFDVALVKNTNDALKVIDHKGNNFLGGMDLDFAIVEQLILPEIVALTGIQNFEEEFRVKYGKYEKLFYQLLYYAEEAKKELSQASKTNIDIDIDVEGESYNLNLTITKEQLDEVFAPKINETIKLLMAMLEHNHLQPASIKQIILVGGTTFLPQVREQLQLQTNIPIHFSMDPTTAVAVGAAYYASNKYYEPTIVVEETNKATDIGASILETVDFNPIDVNVKVSYNKSSRDTEEVLLLFAEGDYNNKYYRLTRSDGGFDTGMVNLKSKKTEFLPLLTGINNQFVLEVYDNNNNVIPSLTQNIAIMQGKFSIEGQPLPHDICIEVDDVENNTTKLEVIFERNALLPQKRTLYREISKTIKKGAKDNVVINILEGDKNARPSSNLTIGCIEIAGKDLQSDIVKGSDIEIEIALSESRELSTTIFIVMSQQEFKSVFSISEKKINLSRLKEQYINLENELTTTIKQMQYNEDEIWEIKANAFLEDLQTVKTKLFKLTDKDKSDEKYIIAEKIAQISQESDKLGGNERIATLLEDYLHYKTIVWDNIQMVDFERDELEKQFRKTEASESTFMKSKNVSFINSKLEQLNDLNWKALGNTTSYLITVFNDFKGYSEANFTSYSSAKAIFKMADKSLEEEKYSEFRKHIYHLSSLLKTQGRGLNKEFNGTGIG